MPAGLDAFILLSKAGTQNKHLRCEQLPWPLPEKPQERGREEGKQGFRWLGYTFGNLAGEHRPKGESMALGRHLSSVVYSHCTISHKLPQFPHLQHRDSAKGCACCIQQVVSKCWSSFPLHPSGGGRAPQGLWVKSSSVETWRTESFTNLEP